MALLYKILVRTAAAVALIAITIYAVWAQGSRRMGDLGPEHRVDLESEFVAQQESDTDWAAYLAIEDALARELEDEVDSKERGRNLLDRHWHKSWTHPDNFGTNWNRSYDSNSIAELTVPSPRGVAVLLHGLSDSPYSMLSMARALAGDGYNVVVPRMPGHGFAVSGLLQVQWEDWEAATRIAVRHAMTIAGGDQEFVAVGYSNGALLALNYALQCDDDEDLRCPDKLIFLSPAISVTQAAMVTNLHVAVSWMPYFEKFQWLSVLPEIDPFKFTSFSKRAAWEMYRFTKHTHKLLSDPDRLSQLPPILAFLSVVDNTVSSRAVIDTLFMKLPANGSGLVLYDVNRNSTIVSMMREIPPDPIDLLEEVTPLNFAVTVLHNRTRTDDGREIDAVTYAAGMKQSETEATDMQWPVRVYSLSHIAIPFPPTDALYGDGNEVSPDYNGVVLGAIDPRGELGVLRLSPNYFLRSRYNPFFEYQASHMRKWLLQE